jgi:hypothetical protein
MAARSRANVTIEIEIAASPGPWALLFVRFVVQHADDSVQNETKSFQ